MNDELPLVSIVTPSLNKGRFIEETILSIKKQNYMPWAVETAVKFLVENPDVVMVYGKCPFIDANGKVLREFPSEPFDLARLVRGPNIIPSPTVFFKKEILNSVGHFDTNLNISADYDLFIRIGLKFRIEYIPKPLAT